MILTGSLGLSLYVSVCVCVCVYLCVFMFVFHHVCDEMAGLSIVLGGFITLYKNSKIQH